MRVVKFLLLIGCVAAGAWILRTGPDGLRDLVNLVRGTPHEQYTARLRLTGRGRTPAGAAWLAAAEQSLARPVAVTLPSTVADVADEPAVAFAASLRRGERYLAEVVGLDDWVGDELFIDLFRRAGEGPERVAGIEARSGALDVEIRDDGEYVLRVQRTIPERLPATHAAALRATLSLTTEPTLLLPVQRATRGSIQSLFGAAREGGSRVHHGVDIFAPRGTPVLAAATGVVTSVGTNPLGGNVVWIRRSGYRESHYYAHLDRQLVSIGAVVTAGDVIGRVGNTGNARTTSPHLHFGIYAPDGPVDPLPYIAPRQGASSDPRLSRGDVAAPDRHE